MEQRAAAGRSAWGPWPLPAPGREARCLQARPRPGGALAASSGTPEGAL